MVSGYCRLGCLMMLSLWCYDYMLQLVLVVSFAPVSCVLSVMLSVCVIDVAFWYWQQRPSNVRWNTPMLSVEPWKVEHIKSTMTCHEEKIETGRWQLPTKTCVQCTVKDQSYCNWIASKCAHDVEAWRMTICHLWRSRWVDRYHTILLHE